MNKTKVSVGEYSMVLTEDILAKMVLLKECEYMVEDLEKIIKRFIELFQGQFDFGDILPADECMRFISTLHEAKKDYTFLSGLEVEKHPNGVLSEATSLL